MIDEAYTRWSETYDWDVNRTRDLDKEVTQQLLAGKHYESIVELGAGTGKNTLFLAEIGDAVLALDFSEGMLRQAREKVTHANVSNVTFAHADLTQRWPCVDGQANLVVCNLVLEHIAGLSIIFAEAARILKTGGEFVLSELHPFRQYIGVKANFKREEETTEIEAFIHNLSDYWDAASENGFAIEEVKEWWHEDDEGKPPRLISFAFQKQ